MTRPRTTTRTDGAQMARDAQIARLLTSGTTYSEIRQQHGLAALNAIARVRQERHITGRSLEQAYAHHITYDIGGHAHWGGAWSGRVPVIPVPGSSGRLVSAVRVGFRMTTGRDPVGYIRPACGLPWCVAALCLHDHAVRQGDHPALTLHGAIVHMLAWRASVWQITRSLNTTADAIRSARRSARQAGGQRR